MIRNRKGYESYLLISSNSTATLVSNFPLINSLFFTSVVSIFFPNFRLLRLLIFFRFIGCYYNVRYFSEQDRGILYILGKTLVAHIT